MADAAHSIPRLTAKEYLEIERQAASKHEFVDGIVYAMAGAGRRHDLIAVDVVGALLARVQPPCTVFSSDMKVRIKTVEHEDYFYPDAHVTCSDLDREQYFNSMPVLVVEVASDSTEEYDRNEKFARYRLLPSLQEYVIVQQVRPQVEVFRKRSEWRPDSYQAGEELTLESVNVTLPVDVFYRRVAF